jgi:tetratricopeptide (TPR) repeat protein
VGFNDFWKKCVYIKVGYINFYLREKYSNEKAGVYYYHVFHNIEERLTPLEEAFYHYDQSGNKDKVQDIGDRLSRIYYDYSMFGNAYFYAHRVYELLGDDTNVKVLNLLGAIYHLYGDYDNALNLFQKALSGFQEIGDKIGTIPTLHNMAGIALKKQDIKKFMEYETTAYKIAMETKYAKGIYNVGNQPGIVLIQNGMKKEGSEMFKRSIEIGKAAGFPDVGKIEEMLRKFGEQ